MRFWCLRHTVSNLIPDGQQNMKFWSFNLNFIYNLFRYIYFLIYSFIDWSISFYSYSYSYYYYYYYYYYHHHHHHHYISKHIWVSIGSELQDSVTQAYQVYSFAVCSRNVHKCYGIHRPIMKVMKSNNAWGYRVTATWIPPYGCSTCLCHSRNTAMTPMLHAATIRIDPGENHEVT